MRSVALEMARNLDRGYVNLSFETVNGSPLPARAIDVDLIITALRYYADIVVVKIEKSEDLEDTDDNTPSGEQIAALW